MRPLGFDAFCGAGGATRGFQLAGFEMWGCDIAPQPRYVGERFFHADALELLADVDFMAQFAFVSASPPCQKFTDLKSMSNAREHPDLIGPTRELLEQTGLPYVIENVPGAPLIEPFQLCGTSFGLGTYVANKWYDLRRHRLFETNWPIGLIPPCAHNARTCGVYGDHFRLGRRSSLGEFSGSMALDLGSRAMGINWMRWPELTQAIPPAMTEWIGSTLMAHLETRSLLAAGASR